MTIRCGLCGRFMSDNEARQAVVTAAYSSPLALDEPDDVYNHRACFEANNLLTGTHQQDKDTDGNNRIHSQG